MSLTPPQSPEDQLFMDIVSSSATQEPCTFGHWDINNSDELMRPKFQKWSVLEFDGRIIPEANPSGINVGAPWGASSFGYPVDYGGVVHFRIFNSPKTKG